MEAETRVRISRLETDMIALKQHQFQHECQIETLAIETHALSSKFADLSAKVDQLSSKVDSLVTREEFNWFKKSTNHHFEKIETQLQSIADALAI